ncbi:hypothetical protein NQ318_013168 [Aromia moschata]|uniref:Hermansky-Pudlak syndrome 5 protein homolog n=1 Tax=Aromia moschata TaxID=1265417 RepID=A0AAV8Y596_9CUCU|nr:hypothetical protein NQ318_013168 [Aromia moschata]
MEKYILVEYLNSLQAVITQTFKSAKRIKLTSFNISNKYIVFGASSGGIYIFKREPCEFIKLIPSKEGSALKIVIAPNEKNIAIGSSKGLLLIVENFLDVNFRFSVVNYHENNIITEIIWHGNDVYCGDNVGIISVFSSNYLLPLFNAPSAIIMQLDSGIVQIDAYLNYLLISTHTRSYLCNTQEEQYKQIGKKLRDGCFGACFTNTNNNVFLTDIRNQSFKGVFETVKEDESFISTLTNPGIKIHCSRPGARIWEANLEATVLMTYQFRESLAQHPSNILHITDDIEAKLNISYFDDTDMVATSFNFGKIYPISNRLLFTYDGNGIYFFDPNTSSLILWTNNFKNIKDIKILNSVLYIWQGNSEIKIVSLELLEDIIIKTFLNKQYYLCAELCINFMEEVKEVIHNSHKIQLISILKDKLPESRATELLDKIKPVLLELEEYNKRRMEEKIIANEIVFVENSCNSEKSGDSDCIYIPESVQDFKPNVHQNENLRTTEVDELGLSLCIINDLYNHDNLIKNEHECCRVNMKEDKLLALYKQYQLNKSHKTAELTEPSILLEELNLDDMFTLFKDFVQYTEKIDKTDATRWCKEQFLKQASKKALDINNLEQITVKYLNETFLELNKSTDFGCKCGFPLPKAHKHPLEFYKLGCKLFDHYENSDDFINLISYLYKYKLSKMNNVNDLLQNLSLLTQFCDRDLFEQFLSKFTYDTWDEIVKLFIKLRQGVCLNCGEDMELDGAWSWTELGMIMTKSIGPRNTARLLQRYSAHIPQGELDVKFYQCCIFSSMFNQSCLAVNFVEKVFENILEKFVHRKYLGHQSVTIKSDEDVEVPKCVYFKQ